MLVETIDFRFLLHLQYTHTTRCTCGSPYSDQARGLYIYSSPLLPELCFPPPAP